MADKKSLGLSGILILCCVGCAAILAALAGSMLYRTAAETAHRSLAAAVTLRTSSAAEEFARSIARDWDTLKFLETSQAEADPDRLRAMFDGIAGDGKRVSWAGFATLDGTVQVATNGLLEGADVSARPWFRAGLQAGFAGDVHEAVMLNRLLGGSESDPLRFVDLARPATRDGRVRGVYGVHLSIDWAEELLKEIAQARNMDLLLISQEGKVVMSSTGDVPDASNSSSLRAAAAGVRADLRETWPDGIDYVSSIQPAVAWGDLPSFGWRIVGRMPIDAAQVVLQKGTISILLTAAMIFTLLLAAAAAFSLIFLRPISTLAGTASRQAKGEDAYPAEYGSSREAFQLSAALSRLAVRD